MDLDGKKSESISIGFEVQELQSVIEILKARGVEFQHIMEEQATRLAHVLPIIAFVRGMIRSFPCEKQPTTSFSSMKVVSTCR